MSKSRHVARCLDPRHSRLFALLHTRQTSHQRRLPPSACARVTQPPLKIPRHWISESKVSPSARQTAEFLLTAKLRFLSFTSRDRDWSSALFKHCFVQALENNKKTPGPDAQSMTSIATTTGTAHDQGKESASTSKIPSEERALPSTALITTKVPTALHDC